MLVIKCNRLPEKTEVEINALAISFFADHFAKGMKEPSPASCVVALNNGVVLWIDKTRKAISAQLSAYSGK